MVDVEARRYAAILGRRHFEGTVTLEALFAHFGSSGDPLIRALLEAAAHQPSRGFAGISEERWEREFWQPVSALLVELEKGAHGEVPASRVYPRSSFLGVVGWSTISLFAIASAAEHGVRLWNLRDPAAQFSVWRAVFESVGLAFMTLASWLAFRGALTDFNCFERAAILTKKVGEMPANLWMQRPWRPSVQQHAVMTCDAFVKIRGSLKAGHAAHPPWLDDSDAASALFLRTSLT